MIRRLLSRFILWALRWKVEGSRPDTDKFVVIAAPHTSNWDLLFVLCVARVMRIKVNWLGKRSLFKGPIRRWLMPKLGGIPVDRRAPGGLVAQLTNEFQRRDALALLVPPAGTRSYRDHWKSGFYHIAVGAGVPVVPGFLNYRTRRAGFGPPMQLTGDITHDMDLFRAFYADIEGKFPAKMNRIILREEAAYVAEHAGARTTPAPTSEVDPT